VNDLGQIVGFYTDAGANVIGFLATPNATPATPASVSTLTEWGMILLSGIVGYSAWRKSADGAKRRQNDRDQS
jgi:hypothetical protein